MPFEHKSLKANFTQFRGSLDRINRLLIKGNEVAPKAETNLGGLVDQLGAVVEDVEAMATLGNFSEGSGEGEEKTKPPAATEQPKTPQDPSFRPARLPGDNPAPVVKLVDTPDSKSVDPVGSNPTRGTITISSQAGLGDHQGQISAPASPASPPAVGSQPNFHE